MKLRTKRKSILVVLLVCLCVAVCGIVFGYSNSPQFVSAATESSPASDFYFLNNSDKTGYKVRAKNKSMTEAIIPESYNGKPVTEISDNGFMSCANLKLVKIPKSVIKVGKNAFIDCNNLIDVIGMPKVQEIGELAFSGCTEVDNLIIPASVQRIGNSVIKDVKKTVYVRSAQESFTSLNPNWDKDSEAIVKYGDEIAVDPIQDDDAAIIGYKIRESQNITVPDKAFALICGVRVDETHYPILNIDSRAFDDCIFKSLSLEMDAEINQNYKIELSDSAFYNIEADVLNLNINAWWAEDSAGIFANSQVKTLFLPDTFTCIPNSAFEGCSRLQQLSFGKMPFNYLSRNITRIGEVAFGDCVAIKQIHIPNTVEQTGDLAFLGWTSNQTIYVEHEDPNSIWGEAWCDGIEDNNMIQYESNRKTFRITFDKDEGTGGTDFVDVTLGESLPNIQIPSLSRHNFNGYYIDYGDYKGTFFFNKAGEGIGVWDIKEDVTLKADWVSQQYTVMLENFNGQNSVFVSVTLGEPMPLEDINGNALKFSAKRGYKLSGYFEFADGEGTKYYDSNMKSTHVWNIELPDNVEYYVLHPVETLIEYKITYVFEKVGSNVPYMNYNPTTYTIEDEVEFKDATMFKTKDLAIFTAWRHDKILVGTTGDITVYGMYGIELYTIGANIPLVGAKRVMLKLPTATDDYTAIALGAYVTHLVVDGVADSTYNMHIDIESATTLQNGQVFNRTNVFNLYLNNVCMQAYAEQAAINMSTDGTSTFSKTLNLYTTGTVKIVGGQGAYRFNSSGIPVSSGKGSNGINCGILYIRTADNLRIEGGRGAHGVAQGLISNNGGDGGYGVYVSQNIIYIYCSNVVIKGGNGGNGNGGSNSGNGGKGEHAVAGSGDDVSVKRLSTATNVHLYLGEDGGNGVFIPDPIVISPVDPINPLFDSPITS